MLKENFLGGRGGGGGTAGVCSTKKRINVLFVYLHEDVYLSHWAGWGVEGKLLRRERGICRRLPHEKSNYECFVCIPSPQAGLSLVLGHEEHKLASLRSRRKEKTEEAEDVTQVGES